MSDDDVESQKLLGKQSDVEILATTIQDRRENRLPISLNSRKLFLQACQAAPSNSKENRITIKDLKKMAQGKHPPQVLKIIHLAIETVKPREARKKKNVPYFYYMDFCQSYTKIVIPWHPKSGIGMALMLLCLYYLMTPIVFCFILRDNGVCPLVWDNPSSYDAGGGLGVSLFNATISPAASATTITTPTAYIGTIYFATVTLATVGYGDLSVDKSRLESVIVGSLYMILSVMVAVWVLGYLINPDRLAGDSQWIERNIVKPYIRRREAVFDKLCRWDRKEEFLYKKIDRFRCIRYAQIVMALLIIISAGLVGNLSLNEGSSKESDPTLNFATGFYWVVQTATTIGYGDLDKERFSATDYQRCFNIVYLLFSTLGLANILGVMSGLPNEIDAVRRLWAWKRHTVTKVMISEMKPLHGGDNVDEYLFVVASLVQLKKVDKSDIKDIMDRFRELSGGKQFISKKDVAKKMQGGYKEIEQVIKSSRASIE